MRARKNLTDRLPLKLDLSTEAMQSQTLVEIFGNGRVIVENHRGIIQYGCDQICIKTKKGFITVHGNGMQVAKMSKEQLVIVGSIERVCF